MTDVNNVPPEDGIGTTEHANAPPPYTVKVPVQGLPPPYTDVAPPYTELAPPDTGNAPPTNLALSQTSVYFCDINDASQSDGEPHQVAVIQAQRNTVPDKPRDWRAAACFACLCCCCCWPLGFFATYFANQAIADYNKRKYDKAKWGAKWAKIFTLVTIFIGTAIIVAVIVFFLVMILPTGNDDQCYTTTRYNITSTICS